MHRDQQQILTSHLGNEITGERHLGGTANFHQHSFLQSAQQSRQPWGYKSLLWLLVQGVQEVLGGAGLGAGMGHGWMGSVGRGKAQKDHPSGAGWTPLSPG